MRLPEKWFYPFLLLVAFPTWAQDSASTRITLTIPDRVQISELQDIYLGAGSGSGQVMADRPLCVRSSTGSYTLSVNSEHAAAGQYRLNADGGFADYQVFWNDGSGFRELKHGEVLDNPNITNGRNCAGPEKSTPYLQVRITDSQLLQAAPTTYYQDHLRLTISTN